MSRYTLYMVDMKKPAKQLSQINNQRPAKLIARWFTTYIRSYPNAVARILHRGMILLTETPEKFFFWSSSIYYTNPHYSSCQICWFLIWRNFAVIRSGSRVRPTLSGYFLSTLCYRLPKTERRTLMKSPSAKFAETVYLRFILINIIPVHYLMMVHLLNLIAVIPLRNSSMLRHETVQHLL